ncbi:MAG: universal stress protein [Pseudomonadota bacterium]
MQITKIVCCIDFSDSSNNAFKTAVDMAKLHGASLDLIHVREPIINPLLVSGAGGLPPDAIHATLAEIEQAMTEKYLASMDPEVPCRVVVRDGHPSTEIIDYLNEVQADLAVVGSRGLSGMGLVLFGSVSRRVAHKAPCNVLVSRRRRQP